MKNLIKSSVLLFVMLLSAASFAQTSKGWHIIGTVGTNNLEKTGLTGMLGAEFGYFTKHVGLTGTYHTNMDMSRNKAAGLKAYVLAPKIDKITIMAAFEVDRHIEKLDKYVVGDYLYKPSVGLAVPIRKRLDARFDLYEYKYKQYRRKDIVKKTCTGVDFTLAYRL